MLAKAGKITQDEFAELSRNFEIDLSVVFRSMQEDIERALDQSEGKDPHDLIREIDGILSGKINQGDKNADSNSKI